MELKVEGSGDEIDANECERNVLMLVLVFVICGAGELLGTIIPAAHSRAAGLGRFAGLAAAIVCEWQRALVGTSLSRSALDSAAYGLVTLILALVLALSLSAPT